MDAAGSEELSRALDRATGVPDDWHGVWEDHVAAVEAFLIVSTQWRALAGIGLVWLGLDYSAVRDGLALAGVEVTPQVWSQIRSIEAGALLALSALPQGGRQ